MKYKSGDYYKEMYFCLFLVALLWGCSGNKKHSGKTVFRMNIAVGVETLDPAFAKDLYGSMWPVHMIYNTLLETDEHLHLAPSLAKSWESSADGLLYTFHLREDVYFQDNPIFAKGKGRRMTAQDVVYSFNRIINPQTASPGAWIFNGHVAEKDPFTAINDSTVQIRLEKPFRPLPQILTMPYCSIVPREVAAYWGKDFRSHPCGTGPFQLHYWDEGNMLVMYKNPHYWEKDSLGKQLPYLDAVQISFLDSKATEFLMFLQDKLDFVNGIDGSFKDLVLNKKGELNKEYLSRFRLEKRTYLNTEYIGFLLGPDNTIAKNSPLASRLVRQAINYAIDRKKIVTYLRNGEGKPANGGFIPAGMPGYDSSAGYYYNPQKSLSLLAAAGHPYGTGLSPITIYTPDNYSDVVNFVASELQDIGIKVQAEIMQPSILKQQMSQSKLQAFRAQWIADYPDAETYMAVFYSHYPAPPNYTRFSNQQFDKWYEESMNLPDTARWAQYRRMDSLAMSYAPLIPLFYDELLHFTQNNVFGFSSNPMNLINLKQVIIKQPTGY